MIFRAYYSDGTYTEFLAFSWIEAATKALEYQGDGFKLVKIVLTSKRVG